MSDIIKEFAKQAGFKVNWQHEDVQAIKMAQYKEFAELIVNECLRMIETESAQYAEPVWAFELVNDIKEYFGIGPTVDDQLRNRSTYFGSNP